MKIHQLSLSTKMVSVNFTHIYIIVRDSGNGETNEKIAYFSNPNFPFTDSEPNYATYTVKVSIMLRNKTNLYFRCDNTLYSNASNINFFLRLLIQMFAKCDWISRHFECQDLISAQRRHPMDFAEVTDLQFLPQNKI